LSGRFPQHRVHDRPWTEPSYDKWLLGIIVVGWRLKAQRTQIAVNNINSILILAVNGVFAKIEKLRESRACEAPTLHVTPATGLLPHQDFSGKKVMPFLKVSAGQNCEA
jgi:hypothetical protein